jgi:ABC-type Fe3+/spermidine/putrescine transport system ATPase subunit
MADMLFQLDGVHLTGGSQPRLADVTLNVQPGVTAVVGPSGAGKTSLLNLLAGFEKPSRGKVTRAALPAGRLPLAWVPQDDGLWPFLNVRQHLLRVQPKGAAGEKRADELLRTFDLTSRSAAFPQTLSRGERNRLSVARSLASDPAVLVMDEPLSHVDPLRRDVYWHAIALWLQERGGSLVFATHEPRLVLAFADDVVCVAQGAVIASGDVRSTYESPATPAVAGCLGEFNWFSDDAATWLGDESETATCVRPERLTMACWWSNAPPRSARWRARVCSTNPAASVAPSGTAPQRRSGPAASAWCCDWRRSCSCASCCWRARMPAASPRWRSAVLAVGRCLPRDRVCPRRGR